MPTCSPRWAASTATRPTRSLTNYQYGQYRNMSLTDPTVFDFYNNLIDGPTKNEVEGWNSHNLTSQTAFDDRLGIGCR